MEPGVEPNVARNAGSIPAPGGVDAGDAGDAAAAGHVGIAARRLDRRALTAALRAARADSLATFNRSAAAHGTPALGVPERAELNPPLWELCHVGWSQEGDRTLNRPPVGSRRGPGPGQRLPTVP